MDTTNETPKKKTARRLPGKRVILIALVVLLAAGAAGAYYYRQRPESKNSDDAQQENIQGTTEETPNPDDIQARYALTKSGLNNLEEGLSDTDKASLYANAAYDGAVLDDPAAQEYARIALDLYPDTEVPAELKNFMDILTEISQGNYASAKTADEETE